MPLHPQCQQVLDAMAALGMAELSKLSVAEARQLSLTPPPEQPTQVAATENFNIPSDGGEAPIRVYRPKAADGGVLVYFHGGGWVLGGLDSHDETCRRLAAGSGAVVVAVDYRLAPETPFPGAANDCYNATAWVAGHARELGLTGQRLAVGGDSAGGNLAAVTAQMARDRSGPDIAFQLLIYPVTDTCFERPSYRENGEGYLLTRQAMEWFWNLYDPKAAHRADPYAAPMVGNLVGLPPALVQVAEFDPLRDEGIAYAEGMQAAGGDVRLSCYDGMMHGFFAMIDAAGEAVAEACQALRAYLQ